MELSDTQDVPDYLQLTTSLAMELAQGLSTPSEVFARHELSDKDARLLLLSPHFQTMLRAARKEWEQVGNTPERIRLKAQMALEELMLPQFQMARDPRTPATARNDAFKSFERLAGGGKTGIDGEAASGPKFVLNINLGEAMQMHLKGETIEQSNDDLLTAE